MESTTLVASINFEDSAPESLLLEVPDEVQWLELPLGNSSAFEVTRIRNLFGGNLLCGLKDFDETGPIASENRRNRLIQAAKSGFDLIELDCRRDLDDQTLAAIPPDQRLISWTGQVDSLDELSHKFELMSQVPARFYKLVVEIDTDNSVDAILPLELLHLLKRQDVIAYASGPAGFWSRILSPFLGSPMVFGKLDSGKSVDGINTDRGVPVDGAEAGLQMHDGVPTISQLIEDYQFPQLNPVSQIYGVVGYPILHSLSPRLHNSAYRQTGIKALLLPFLIESLDQFWREFIRNGRLEKIGFPPKGFTITAPHKEAIIKFTATQDEVVKQALSSNVVVLKDGCWHADTTDPQGVLGNLDSAGIDLDGRKIVVVGCGGSGKAIASALAARNARVTLVNRGLDRGNRASKLMELPMIPLAEFNSVRLGEFSILINATPIGRHGESLPFSVDQINNDFIAIDLVYGSQTTPLVSHIRMLGGTVFEGFDVLLEQVASQFLKMTGASFPVETARQQLIQSMDLQPSITH